MKSLTRIGSALALVLAAPLALAQSVTVSNTTAVINTVDHASTILLDRQGGPIEGYQFSLAYNNAQLGLPAFAALPNPAITVSVGGASCSSTGSQLTCVIVPPDSSVATVSVTVRWQVGPTAAVSPLTLSGVIFTDGAGEPVSGVALNNGSVTIIEAQPDTNLAYTPAPGGTVTFPAGVALTTQNASIGITTTGTVGAGTISNCGITGTGAASFGPPPAGTISVNGGSTGTIPLTCTLPNSGGAATATLTCTETDADTPAPGAARSWTLSCPQGTPVPGPGFGASPATNTPATAINCSGQAGTSVTRQITITNNGNPGSGSALDFTCTGGGIVSITSGGSATGLAVGASQTVNVSCAVPADGVTSTGTVSCTSNAPGGPFVFNYSATGSTLPPPVARPAVVPASSTWSQIALIALLAGLGLAFVGFRRGQ